MTEQYLYQLIRQSGEIIDGIFDIEFLSAGTDNFATFTAEIANKNRCGVPSAGRGP